MKKRCTYAACPREREAGKTRCGYHVYWASWERDVSAWIDESLERYRKASEEERAVVREAWVRIEAKTAKKVERWWSKKEGRW